MILRRSTSMLHFYHSSPPTTPKLLSHLTHSYFLSTTASSPPFRLICFNHAYRRRARAFSTAAVAVSSPKDTGKDTFFAEETVSWQSLGLSDRVSQALSNAGFDRPSLVQAACMPSILSGKDVVIAAETGSGQTYGYLVPLIEKLCSSVQHDGDNDSEKATASSSSSHTFSVVLCPNVLLCEQVVRMANDLSDDNGKPLLRVAAVCGRQGWPVNEPDIIVSTPVAFLNSIDPKKHHRADFIRAVKYVVFDEADMLLSGGFENHVIRLIHMLRFDENLLSRMNKSGAENPVELNFDSVSQFDFEGEEEMQNESIAEDEEIFEGDVDAEDLMEETQTLPVKRNAWRRVRKIYERSKQYIFVAAALPVNGKRTAGAVLKKMFPDANWVNGSYLHQHNPRLKENWIEVTTDTQVDALIEAVKQFDSKALDHGDGVSRTMVFGNTVEAAEAVANILQRVGMECYRYHKDLTLEERADSLDGFREKGGIFVCTDAAARGVDIPNVSHVIQGLGSLGSIAVADPVRKHVKLDPHAEVHIASSGYQSCIIEFDGTSKGNPGPAGAAAVLKTDAGNVICKLREGLGTSTNNAAEYRAVILGLKYALRKGYTNIRVRGDSKLVCMQLQGLWKVKHEHMAELYEQAKKLKDKFRSFQINHVLRELNGDADAEAEANLAVKLVDGQFQEELVSH